MVERISFDSLPVSPSINIRWWLSLGFLILLGCFLCLGFHWSLCFCWGFSSRWTFSYDFPFLSVFLGLVYLVCRPWRPYTSSILIPWIDCSGGQVWFPCLLLGHAVFCSYSHRGFLKCLSSCEVCCFLPSLRGPVVWLCDWLFSICLSCLLQLFVLLVPILGPLPGIRFCLNGEGILSLGSPWCFTLFVGLICSLTFCVRCAVTLQTVGRLTIGSWR